MKILIDNYESHITLKRMLPIWKKMGHNITIDPYDKCDIHLGNVRFQYKTRIPKVLRLDGIYYNLDDNYKQRNSSISIGHSKADGIIYQSNYSKKLIENILTPRKNNSIYSVIYNGIESDWCGQSIEHDGINISVANKWRRIKRLKEIIELFLEFTKEYPNSKLNIFGRLHENKPIKHPNIKYHGHINRDVLIDYYKKTDFTLHLSKRDSCPNSVIEYIGAGIPVITTNNCGGSTEVCKITDGCIIINGDGNYNDVEPNYQYSEECNVLSNDVFKNILNAMKELSENKRTVSLPIELTNEYMAEEYIKLMKKLI